jgi:FkbM family methyltransferase
METTTKQHKFLDQTLTLTCQSTEHTIGLIQQEISTYKSLFKVDFQPGDIILDLGANLGIISILLSKKFPFTKIYSFEASPINFQNFVKNIEDNNCTNITPFNLAVWSTTDDTIEIPTSPTNSGGSSIYYKPEFFDQYPVSKVKTISLEDILSQNNIEDCKLLKIDVEGAEYEIFKSFPEEKLNIIKNIGIEFHRCDASKLIDLKQVLKNNQINIVCEFNAGGGKLK